LQQQSVQGRITFLSHAPTAAVLASAFPADEPVEPRELAKLAALRWSPPTVQQVCAAPEQRTRQTAEVLGLPAVLTAELRDVDYRAWRGRSLDDIQAADPESVTQWITDPGAAPHGGESLANLLLRVENWLTAQRHCGHTLAVTHPAVVRAAIVLALQAPAQSFWRVDIPPLTVTDLRWRGGQWTVRSSGCRLC
jgi:broad specificity phosphatase PhoE